MSHQKEQKQIIKAPEFNVKNWIDANGNKIKNSKLSDFKGKFKIVFCFQSWCIGCHSKGFPDLQKMVKELNGNDTISFMAIQTVFEGYHANTYQKMIETLSYKVGGFSIYLGVMLFLNLLMFMRGRKKAKQSQVQKQQFVKPIAPKQ